MSAWGAQKRNIDDLVAGVASGKLACVVVLSGRAFDDAAAVTLAEAIGAPAARLTELRCSSHALTAVGAAALGRAVGASTIFETLDAGDATLGDEGVQALALCLRCPSLKTLNLEAKGMGDAGARALAASLSHSLDKLDVSRNELGEAGVVALAGALKARNRPLLNLDVSGCANARRVQELCANVISLRCADLGPGAFDCAAFSPLHCKKLFKLDVSNCGLDAAAVCALARAASLVELRYAGNAEAGDAAAAAVARSAAPLALIDASGTGLTATGALALMKSGAASVFANDNAFGDAGIAELAAGLPAAPELRTLGLSKTGMGDEGAIAMSTALTSVVSVETLEVGGNAIGDAGAKALRRAEASRAAAGRPLDVAMLDDRNDQREISGDD